MITVLYISFQISVVAWFDFKTRKISNIWPLLNICLYFALPLIVPEQYSYRIETWFVPLAFVFVGFILFKLDIMGAGDSKYLFSLFLIIPQALHENLLIKLLSVTVVVGAILLTWRIISQWKKFKIIILTRVNTLKSFLGGKFTYAPVILAAWFWFVTEVGVQ